MIPALFTQTIETILNENLNSTYSYCIYFGEDKTKSIVFETNKKIKGLRELDIKCGDKQIKKHPYVKYLGCVLNKNLSRQSMALQAITKINVRLKSFLSNSLKRLLCNAFSLIFIQSA